MSDIRLIEADSSLRLAQLSALAHVIWQQHYTPIIGKAQVDYMLAKGYSETALASQRAAGTRFTLAERGQRFVAFAAVSPDPTSPTDAWLDKLYVHIEARNLGLGRRLIEHCAIQARGFGANVLRLRVNRYNKDSIRAYERIGFTMAYEDVKEIGGGFVMDDYVMTVPLDMLLAA